MKPAIVLVVALLLYLSSFGQDRKLLGRVFDADTRKPLKNVVIAINGTTFTNDRGYFEVVIDPAKHKIILASRLGYKTVQIPVPSDDDLEFGLSKSYTELLTLDLARFPNNNAVSLLDPKSRPHTGQVQAQAKYSGGIAQFYQAVGNELANWAKRIDRVTLDIFFTVDEQGKIVDITYSDSNNDVKTNVTPIFLHLPVWTPALQNGENVSQHFHLPVRKGGEVATNESAVVTKLIGEMRTKINYPVAAQRMGIDGDFLLKFVLNESGDILTLEVLRDPGGECGSMVARGLAAVSGSVRQDLTRHYKHNTFLLQGAFKFEKASDPKSDDVDLLALHKDARLLPMRLVIEAATPEPYVREARSQNGVTETVFINLANALSSSDSVKKLSLRNKQLSVFPKEILELRNLEYLDLEGNVIESLPEDIGKLNSLTELYLVRNQLSALPKNFATLKKLRILGVSGNKFKMVPGEILQIEKLETLDISSNSLNDLPAELGKMKFLKVLSLQRNLIAHIPAVLLKMPQLERLYLIDNPLSMEEVEKLRNALPGTTVFF